jgi:hypothetical protein
MRYVALLLVVSFVSVAQAAIQWDHWSPLTVVETIIHIGEGDYRYEYSFTNVDTSPIYGFALYTAFEARDEESFAGHPTWYSPVFGQIYDVGPAYDARNLDPDIIGLISHSNCQGYPWGTVCPSETAIQIGEYAFGFSFAASVYDPSPKYYFYETIDSGWAVYTGEVAAVGLTVPEPATTLFLTLGGLLLFRKRRA